MEQFFGIILSAIFGAIFGSYATLFAYRLPRGESCFGRYFGQKSRCPECGTILKTRELIPLINWIITMGKCKTCKTKIPRTHLFIELSNTILFILCYLKFGFSEEFILNALICTGSLILMVSDYTHKKFPYQILIFVLMLGLANRILQDQEISSAIISSGIGVVFATIFYQIFYKKTEGFFANQNHSIDYAKFILIAAVCLPIKLFIFYFLITMSIFTMFLFFNVAIRKNHNNFAYAIIIPFIWLIL